MTAVVLHFVPDHHRHRVLSAFLFPLDWFVAFLNTSATCSRAYSGAASCSRRGFCSLRDPSLYLILIGCASASLASRSRSSRVFASDLILLLEALSSDCFYFLKLLVFLIALYFSFLKFFVISTIQPSPSVTVSSRAMSLHLSLFSLEQVSESRRANCPQVLPFSVDRDSKLFSIIHLLFLDLTVPPFLSALYIFLASCETVFQLSQHELCHRHIVTHDHSECLARLAMAHFHGSPQRQSWSARTLVCSHDWYKSVMSLSFRSSLQSSIVVLSHFVPKSSSPSRCYQAASHHDILPTIRLATSCHCVCAALRTQLLCCRRSRCRNGTSTSYCHDHLSTQ